MDDGPELAEFVRASLKSLWALELLLLLRAQGGEARPAQVLVRELRANASLVGHLLQQLGEAGLAVRSETGEYRYAPASPVLAVLCDRLEAAYRARPLSVVRTITASPNRKLQSFADAFRLKRDK